MVLVVGEARENSGLGERDQLELAHRPERYLAPEAGRRVREQPSSHAVDADPKCCLAGLAATMRPWLHPGQRRSRRLLDSDERPLPVRTSAPAASATSPRGFRNPWPSDARPHGAHDRWTYECEVRTGRGAAVGARHPSPVHGERASFARDQLSASVSAFPVAGEEDVRAGPIDEPCFAIEASVRRYGRRAICRQRIACRVGAEVGWSERVGAHSVQPQRAGAELCVSPQHAALFSGLQQVASLEGAQQPEDV